MFKNLFGGGAGNGGAPTTSSRPSATAATKDSTLNAIAAQKAAADDLEKQIAFLETKANKERDMAKQYMQQKTNVTANQAKAKQHLKNKKMYETRINNLQAQMQNLLGVADSLETLKANQRTAAALKTAKEEFERANKQMPLEKLDDVVADLQEEMQKATEAQDVLGQNLTGEVDVDDDLAELEAELEGEKLEAEEEEEEEEAPKLKQKKAAALPPAPTHKPKPKIKQEDDEDEALKALEAEMASS